MYRFGYIQTHPKCPDVVGWWLMLDHRDFKTMEELHSRVTTQAFMRFQKDPHLQKSYDEGEVTGLAHHPVTRGTRWLSTAIKLLTMDPKITVLVNAHGGMCYVTPGCIIHRTVEREDLRFPTEYAENPFERITIKRWPGERHYYLSSNQSRIFAEPKYDTVEEAEAMAVLYVPKDRITLDENPTTSITTRPGRVQIPSKGD